MHKKFLFMVLALVLVMALMPATVFANAGDIGTKSTQLFTSVKIDDVEVTESSWYSTWNIFQAKTAQVIDMSNVKLNVTAVEGTELKYSVGSTKYPTGGKKGVLVNPADAAYRSFTSSFDEVKSSLSAENSYIWILATKGDLAEVVTVQVKELAGTILTNDNTTISGPGTYKVSGDVNSPITINATGAVTLIIPANSTVSVRDRAAITVSNGANVTITVNGQITGSGNNGVIVNNGTLTIGGPGTITGASANPVIVNNGTALTLQGSLTIANNTNKSAEDPYYVIDNKTGTLKVSLNSGNGSITSASGGIKNARTLNVTNGSIKATDNAIDNTGTAEINNSHIYGTVAASGGSTTFTSVTSEPGDSAPSILVRGSDAATVTVNSGIYNGGVTVNNSIATVNVLDGTFKGVFQNDNGTIKISGGQFIGEDTQNSVKDFLEGKVLDSSGQIGDAVAEIDLGNGAKLNFADLGTAIGSGKGYTVTLLQDIDSLASNVNLSTAPAGEVTLDLNGHHIAFADKYGISVSFGNKLIVKDSTAPEETGTTTNGYITNVANSTAATISVSSGATFELQSGVVKNVSKENSASAIVARTLAAGTADMKNANIVIKGGKVEAEGSGIFIANNANLTVEGGEIYSQDSFAISGNGNGNYNPTTITINGGKISSNATTAIYHPQVGTLTVTGGEITGQAGIVMRNGELTVSNGTITATGTDKLGTVGTANPVTASAVVVAKVENAYGDATATITGGTFTSNSAQPVVAYVNGGESAPGTEGVQEYLSISGGTFSGGNLPDGINKFIVEGKAAHKKDETSYIVEPIGTGAEITKVEYYHWTEYLVGEFGSGTGTIDDPVIVKFIVPNDSLLHDARIILTLSDSNAKVYVIHKDSTPTDAEFTYVGPKENGNVWIGSVPFIDPDDSTQNSLYVKVVSEDGKVTKYYKITVDTTEYTVNIPDPVVTIPEDSGMTKEQVTAVTEAAKEVAMEDSSMNELATEALKEVSESTTQPTVEAATKALEDAGISGTTSENVTMVVQTYMDVKVDSYTEDESGSKTLTFDITPMYRVVATTKENADSIKVKDDPGVDSDANAVKIGEPKKLTVTKPVEMTLGLPSDFTTAESVYIKHAKDNGKTYYYTGTVADNDTGEGKVVNFTNPHGFSSFTLYSNTPDGLVASIGDTSYTSLQDAVDDVKNGDIIKLLKETDEKLNAPVTGSDDTFTFTIKAGDSGVDVSKIEFNTTTSGGYTYTATIDKSGKVTVTRTQVASSSGGGHHGSGHRSSSSATVTSEKTTNGSFTVSDKNAAAGATVKVTPKANKGYVVDEVTVTDDNGRSVRVKDNVDGTYSFVMPEKAAQPVSVEVTFKPEVVEKDTPSDKFADVAANAWYREAVDYVVANGLMNGTDANNFAPNATTTRAMVVTILYRLEGEPATTRNLPFADVAAGTWYSDAINWASTNGIVTGYDENTFGPNDSVTRAQMAAILYRYAELKGYNVARLADLAGYTDAAALGSWADAAMRWSVAEGLIEGTASDTLSPNGNSTRAQIATILMRFCEGVAK